MNVMLTYIDHLAIPNPKTIRLRQSTSFFPIGLRYPVGVKHHLPMESHVSDHFPMVLI